MEKYFTQEMISFIKKGLKADKNYSLIASELQEEFEDIELSHRTLRKKISEMDNGNYNENVITDENNNYSKEDLDAYLKTIGVDKKLVKSVKAYNPNGKQGFSVVFNPNEVTKPDKLNELYEGLEKKLTERSDIKYSINLNPSKSIVISLADFHIGAAVQNLINTPDFNDEILIDKLDEIATVINSLPHNQAIHIAMLGDFIESFTGRNHVNSWQYLDKFGSKAVIAAYDILLNFLSKIDNLAGVYIVSGNHDRISSMREGDLEGGVAEILYNFLARALPNAVETDFHPLLLSKEIDGINYILTHGHLGISKNNISDVVFRYGNQDIFNVILSGHLHTRKKRVEKIDAIIADCDMYRGYYCPSLFTGNFYSEGEGWTSTSGFYAIFRSNRLPVVIDMPVE